MKEYQFGSSHGDIIVDAEGYVTNQVELEDADYLAEIVKLNLEEYREYLSKQGVELEDHYHHDILDVGFWDQNGVYEEPEHSHREFKFEGKKFKG